MTELRVTFDDPIATAAAVARLSGLEAVQAIIDGRIPAPPIARLLGFRLAAATEGRAVFEAEPGAQHFNPIGVVHGGFAATLLDSAMGCAVHTLLPAGRGYTTVELKVSYARPITLETRVVRAIGSVLHAGKRVALAEGRLVDDEDRLLAHATTTCLLLGG